LVLVEPALQTPEIPVPIRLLLEVLLPHHLPLPVLFLLVVVAVVGLQTLPVGMGVLVVVVVLTDQVMDPVEQATLQ
jgi:hypothetical protein